MKRIVIGAIAGPLIVWVGLWTVGGKRMDDAGTRLTQGGLVLPVRFGLLLEAASAGALAAWLTKRA